MDRCFTVVTRPFTPSRLDGKLYSLFSTIISEDQSYIDQLYQRWIFSLAFAFALHVVRTRIQVLPAVPSVNRTGSLVFGLLQFCTRYLLVHWSEISRQSLGSCSITIGFDGGAAAEKKFRKCLRRLSTGGVPLYVRVYTRSCP